VLIAGMVIPLPLHLRGCDVSGRLAARNDYRVAADACGVVLIVIPAAVGVLVMLADARGWSIGSGGGAIAAGADCQLAGRWLQAPTVRRSQVHGPDRGPSAYLGVARGPAATPEPARKKTPELFERFLPYAVTLDVETAGERFAGGAGGGRPGGRVPLLYAGTTIGRTIRSALRRSLVGCGAVPFSQTIASASTPPGSSDGCGIVRRLFPGGCGWGRRRLGW